MTTATAWIHPNWHVVLIHYPLALLTAGLGVEVLTWVVRRPATLRIGGRWMVLIGALLCWPTAMSGVYAYYDVVRRAPATAETQEPVNLPWYRLMREAEGRFSVGERENLEHHIWRAAGGTVVLSVGVVIYLGSSDRWRRRLYVPVFLWMLAGTGVIVWGAWYGGEFDGRRLEGDSLPAVQVHVLLAGLTVAAAVGAVGMAIRGAVAGRPAARRESHDVAYADSPAVQVRMTVIGERVAVGRYWLVGLALAVVTAAVGLWVGTGWRAEALAALAGQARDLAHLILGGVIVMLMGVLACLGRWGRRRVGWLTVCAGLLLLCVAAQIWVGVLLLYDGSGGAGVTGFQAPIVQGD